MITSSSTRTGTGAATTRRSMSMRSKKPRSGYENLFACFVTFLERMCGWLGRLVVGGGDGSCFSYKLACERKVVELSWSGVCSTSPQLHQECALLKHTKNRRTLLQRVRINRLQVIAPQNDGPLKLPWTPSHTTIRQMASTQSSNTLRLKNRNTCLPASFPIMTSNSSSPRFATSTRLPTSRTTLGIFLAVIPGTALSISCGV